MSLDYFLYRTHCEAKLIGTLRLSPGESDKTTQVFRDHPCGQELVELMRKIILNALIFRQLRSISFQNEQPPGIGKDLH